jgi:acetoacetate decarboxylase
MSTAPSTTATDFALAGLGVQPSGEYEETSTDESDMTDIAEALKSNPGEIAGWPKLVVKYTTDQANIDPLLPPGMTPLDDIVQVGVYCIPILEEPEYGCSIKVSAEWQGVGEINGQPKFLCDIDYFRLGDRVGARATHQGYTFFEYAGAVTGPGDVVEGDFTEHEWWTKYSRAIGNVEKQYDFAPVVVDVATTFEQRHVENLDGEMILRDSPWDPVQRHLPCNEVVSAQLVTHQAKARNITNAGPLDPDAFWPYADTIGGSRWPGERGGPRR